MKHKGYFTGINLDHHLPRETTATVRVLANVFWWETLMMTTCNLLEMKRAPTLITYSMTTTTRHPRMSPHFITLAMMRLTPRNMSLTLVFPVHGHLFTILRKLSWKTTMTYLHLEPLLSALKT
jgi:hypothetical protein